MSPQSSGAVGTQPVHTTLTAVGEFRGYARGEPEARRISLGLFAAGLATFTLLYSTQAILPHFTRDYGVSPSEASLSVSAATVGLGIGLLAAVPISERVGRVRLIRFSLAVAAGLGLLVAFVPDWTLFLAGRFAMGFVLAGLPATAAVYLREEIRAEDAASATGLYVFGTAFGGLMGRIVSSFAVSGLEWTGADEPGAPLAFLFGPGGLLSASHAALLAAALVACACATVCWTTLPESRGFTPRREPLAAVRSRFLRALGDPVLIGLYAVGGLCMGTFVGTFNALGYRLESAPYLLSTAAIGLLYVIYPIAGYSSVLAGRAADRLSLVAVLPAGPLVCLAGVGIMAAEPLWLIIVGAAVMAAGFFAAHATATAWTAARAQSHGGVPAQAASLYMVCYYAGSSLNGTLAPWAWEVDGWRGAALLCAGMSLIALVVAVALGRSARRPA